MGDDSSLPEPSARRLARVDIPVLTSGRGRETSPGRSLYGWAKFRLRTFSKNPHNSRTKGAECGLTAGHCHESPVFETVLAQVPPEPPLTHAIMDKGYDSDGIREHLIAHDIAPVIPSKSNRRAPLDYDK